MPAFTVNRGYPYPLGSDPGDVPQALEDLAEAIDDDVCSISAGLSGRPMARYRGTGSFSSPAPAAPLTADPTKYRVPFDVEDFDTIGVTPQSMEIGNRLIKPDVPGFYVFICTVYVPVLTLATTLELMDVQVKQGSAAAPGAATTLLSGSSFNQPVSGDDRNIRVISCGGGVFMNGTTDAFCVEFLADTTPNVAEYIIGERTLTLLRMTQS